MENQQTTTGETPSLEIPIQHDARLTSSEIAQLWATFMNYSLLTCIFSYFEKVAQKPPVKELMADTLSRMQKRVSFVAETFSRENIPIPMGFTDQDVNLSAPALFSDEFLLHYLRNMIRVGMTLNALNINMATRPDILNFYNTVLQSIMQTNDKVIELQLSKGLLPRPPYIFVAQTVEHIHKTRFLTGFFGEKRPLLTIEIAHLYHNALVNEIGKSLLLAFRQVSPNKDVRDYFTKGMRLADTIVDNVTRLARTEYINFNYIRDGDITESTTPPFSDKLMVFHVYLLNTIGAGMYGVSGAVSARHDIMKMYGQFMIEVGMYAEEGAKLMMKYDWLEEPPQIIDREELAEYKH
ncbi:MAG: DUF3231 family protein [Syntrophomonas sp.]